MKKNRDLYGKNQQIADDVHEIKTVLTGAEPSGLVPNPPPGVVKSLNALEATVAGHTKSLGTLLRGTAALIADSKPNDGSTSRDTLNIIVDEQNRVADELKDKEDD